MAKIKRYDVPWCDEYEHCSPKESLDGDLVYWEDIEKIVIEPLKAAVNTPRGVPDTILRNYANRILVELGLKHDEVFTKENKEALELDAKLEVEKQELSTENIVSRTKPVVEDTEEMKRRRYEVLMTSIINRRKS